MKKHKKWQSGNILGLKNKEKTAILITSIYNQEGSL